MSLNKPSISAVINIRNEADYLPKCLKSLVGFADEVIVVDMQSTDNGAEIAKNYGAKVYPHRWLKVVEPARNYGISKAKGKWIIILDPDEYIGKTLKSELRRITTRDDITHVRIPRKNIIFGKWIKHSKFWPDYLVRFFRNGQIVWKKEIHSQPDTAGQGVNLIDSEKMAIRHQNYENITSFIIRNLRYSNIQAEELILSGYKLRIVDFILKPVQEFNSRFFASEGYKDGIHGLVISLLQSFSVCLVYLRLWEKTKRSEMTLSKESFVSASLESSYEYGYWFLRFFTNEYSKNIFKNIFMKVRLFIERITKNF